MNYLSRLNKEEVCHFELTQSQEKCLVNSRVYGEKTCDEENEVRQMGYDRIFTTTVILVAMLQVRIGSCTACQDGEITYQSNKAGEKDKCAPCIDCPDGMEPSIACGTVAKNGTLLHCVACREGTYSDTYGKEQCTPCSLCSAGRTVTRNCSRTENSRCGTCKHGYYEKEVVDGLIYDCEPCSSCCWDGKDEFEDQCKAQRLPRHRRCKLRKAVSDCQRINMIKLTPSPTTPQRKSTAERRTNKLKSSDKTTQRSSSTTHRSFVSSNTVTASAAFTSFFQTSIALQRRRNKTYDEGRGKGKTTLSVDTKRPISVSISRNDEISRSIKAVIGIFASLSLVVCIVKIKKIANSFKWVRCRPFCRSRDAEHDEHTESVLLDNITTLTNVEPLGVLVCMKDLKSFSLETYEKVWKRLDKKLENTKKGNYKDVASEFKFEEEDIWEFEKELHSYRPGSPSEKLLESLEAKRPNLTVLEFIKVLQKSTIQRKDIIELLESHIYRHCETS